MLTGHNAAAELRLLVESSAIRSISLEEQVGMESVNASMLLAFDPATGLRMGEGI